MFVILESASGESDDGNDDNQFDMLEFDHLLSNYYNILLWLTIYEHMYVCVLIVIILRGKSFVCTH